LPEDDQRVRSQLEFISLLRSVEEKAISNSIAFPSPTGEFNWLWSYSPPAMIPSGLHDVKTRVVTEKTTHVATPDASDVSVLVVTMNCFGELPPEASLLEPLFKGAARKNAGPAHADPGLVVVCLQETCNLAYAFVPSFGSDSRASLDWASTLETAVNTVFRTGTSKTAYRRVHFSSLVGMALVVFARGDKRTAECLSKASISSEARCGHFNAGNKGAVSVSLASAGLTLCIVCLHLHAGGDADQRTRDTEELLRQLRFDDGAQSLNVFEHDLVIWAGDFNSRCPGFFSFGGTPKEQDDELLSLLRSRASIWGLFQEMAIDFAPSYKLKPKELAYDESRTPAWCDRVLWWARPDKLLVQPLAYRSIDEVLLSDHKPVSLRFDVRLVDPKRAPSHQWIGAQTTACTQQ